MHTYAFSKVSVFISAKRGQKIFIHTSVFRVIFTCPRTLENDETNRPGIAHVLTSQDVPSAMLLFDWNRWYVTLFTSRFQKSPFSPVHTRNDAFSKVFVFVDFFGFFSVDDRPKRMKKYAF